VSEGVVSGAAYKAGELERERFTRLNFRHNFLIMLADSISFQLATSLMSQVTILPLFVREITNSTLAVGLITAIASLGTLLPAIFVAGYIEQKAIQKWYLFIVALVERFPILALSILTPLLGRSNPDLLLWVFFGAWTMHNLAMGLNMPSYFNLFSKVIPPNRRGITWGLGGTIGGLLAILGSSLSGVLLERYGFPDAFALIFFIAFVILFVGILGFPFTRELPSEDVTRHRSILEYLRRAPKVLLEDREFGLFVGAQAIYTLAFMASAFYTAYAIDRFGASPQQVALFTTILMGSNTVANLLYGTLADRRGNKIVLQVAMSSGVIAPLIAAMAPSIEWFYIVFALNGLMIVGSNMGSSNMPLEFAPPGQVPTYSSINMAITAPLRSLVPILGGVIAGYGYAIIFVIAMMAALLALLVTSMLVRDPRFTRSTKL